MDLKFESDKDYLGTVLTGWRTYVGGLFLAVGLLERLRYIHVPIPPWTIITVGVLLLILAQYEAYRKLEGQKNTEIENQRRQLEQRTSQPEKELKELRARISAVPFSFRLEIDTGGPRTTIVFDAASPGGATQRFHMVVPHIYLVLWKRPSSRDLEVTLTTCCFRWLQNASPQPSFSVRRIIMDEETIEVTEKLVKFIAGDPFNRDRLFLFEQDIIAILGYEVLSVPGETSSNFRLKGKLEGGFLHLAIEHLPNPSTPTVGH